MANTQKYLNHLLQHTGITPACSEEERLAAEELAGIFRNHGFDPEVQEFTAAPSGKTAVVVLGIMMFVGSLFMGFGGAVGGVGFVLVLAAGILFGMEKFGHPFLSKLGTAGLSQNVIAYHKAEGPLASPRNRPVVVVAHYDSPRGDIMAQMPYATYRSSLVKALPVAMVVPVVAGILRVLPLPGFLKVILWLVAIAASLVPLAFAVAAIVNRFMLPYSSGAVCNRSSVATMLGVMDAVAPFKGADEFPDDVPFDQYLGEQKRRAADVARAAAAYGEEQGDAPVIQRGEGDEAPEGAFDDGVQVNDQPDIEPEVEAASESAAEPVDAELEPETEGEPEEVSTELPEAADEPSAEMMTGLDVIAPVEDEEDAEDSPEVTETEEPAVEPLDEAAEEPSVATEPEPEPALVNIAGNIRHGKDVVASLGMLPAGCDIEYDAGQMPEPPVAEAAPEPEPELEPAPASSPAPVAEKTEAFAKIEPEGDDDDAWPVDTEGYRADNEYYETAEPMEYAASSYEETPGGMEHVTEALSSFGEKASGFFNRLIKRGKDMVDSFESARAAEEDAQEQEKGNTAPDLPAVDTDATEEPEVTAPASESQQAPVDATTAFEPTPAEPAPAADEAAPVSVSATVSFDRTEISPALEDAADETVVTEEPAPQKKYSTQIFTMPTTDEAEEKPVETVESLMAEISSHVAASSKKEPEVPEAPASPAATVAQPAVPAPKPALNAVPDPSLPSLQQVNPASRASLFDLPDPSSADEDPLGEKQPVAPAPAETEDRAGDPDDQSKIGVIHAAAPAPATSAEKPKKKGFGGLFGRKKKEQQSMSDWLGVDDGFDAKNSGRDIGSWDNFEGDDWKGGAASSDGATTEEMVSAVASMGDDELLGHDIWFVATGASERDNAGIKAFLETHRDKLRGVFFINLESIGAGRVSMVASEGDQHIIKSDRRIMNLVSRVSSAFHVDYAAVDMPFAKTDAHAVLESSLRALTIAGIDGPRFACSRTDEDAPANIDPSNVAMTAEVVTEVIRRS